MIQNLDNALASSTLSLSSGCQLAFYLIKESSGLLNLRMRLGGESEEHYLDTPLTPLETERIMKILAAMGRGRA